MDPQGGCHSTIRYSYRYDGLNRLVHSTGFYQRSMNGFEVTEPPKKFELAYGYAQNGNMLHKEVLNPESHTLEDRWSYGYSNHSVTGIDSTLHGADRFYMQYDAAGNMIRQADNSKNLIKEMQYDSNNRIKTVTNPSNGETVGQYWYDDQGFRVHKISRREVEGEMKEHELLYTSKYMGIEIQKDNEGGEIQNSYAIVNNIYMNGVRIAAVVPGGNALHYLTDQVDSVKVVVNDSGLPVSRMEYMPYGETWFQEGEENHTPKYNSQELDKETGYYFYNARYYDPEIARFVTADNVIDGQFDTQGWNRYSYVKSNPILYKDPDGHTAFKWLDDAIDTTLKTVHEVADYNDKYHSKKTEETSKSGNLPKYLYHASSAIVSKAAKLVTPKDHKDVEQIAMGSALAQPFNSVLKLGEGVRKAVGNISETLSTNRNEYFNKVGSLVKNGEEMLKRGASYEQTVKEISPLRNALKADIRQKDPLLIRKGEEIRNIVKYGNKLGPSPDQLFEKFGSWEKAYEKIGETNKLVDKMNKVQ